MTKTLTKSDSRPRDIPDGLLHFDQLPQAAYVDQRVVEGLYDCSSATVWRRVKRGDIPKPQTFGRHARWNVGRLRLALAGK